MTVTKSSLLALCKTLGITGVKYKTKEQLRQCIKEYEDVKQTKVISSGKTIKYIYHSADIHIRTLERHEEYMLVFENLCEALKKQDNLHESVFVICGDIFHNRDRLVSETIILFNKLIEKLVSIIDVIMIPGNHDIFTHTDRLDTISGIVNIKEYENFHFLKNSGVYCYHNLNFIVCSLVDNKFIRASEIEVNDRVNICLYHGCVIGSKLDNDYIVPESNGLLKTRDFKGYDLVLLGDIHKRQFLTDTIAYPGSLIQQNFKEEVEHGIIKWNIDNKKGEFLNVKNDYGYVTLHVKGDNFNETSFPRKSRIKLIHEYDEDIDYEKVKENISKYTSILSISKEISNVDCNKTSQSSEISGTDEMSREMADKRVFNELISSYKNDTKEKLLSLHLNYLKNLNDDNTLLKNSSWYIKSIEFKNVYIYGGDHLNIIDFETRKGVTGILQQNASGKSSIMNILLYTIFGNITKTKSFLNRNIINKGANDYFIKMKIQMGEKEYTIHRKGKNKTRKNKSKSMEETLEFSYSDNNGITNITDTNKVVTQEKIKEVFGLGEKEMFILTNVMNYSNYISILNMTSGDIGNVFSKLFNMENYKEIYSLVLKECKVRNDELKVLKGQTDALKEGLNDPATKEELQEIQEELSIYQKKKDIVEAELEFVIKKDASISIGTYVNKKEEDLEKSIEALENELETLPVCDLTVNEVERKIKGLLLEISKDVESKVVTDKDLQTLKEMRNKIKFHKVIRPCSVKESIEAEKFLNNFVIPHVDLHKNESGDYVISKEEISKFKFIIGLVSGSDTSTLQSFIDAKTLVKEYKNYTELLLENKQLEKDYKEISEMINFVVDEEIKDLKLKSKFLQVSKQLSELREVKENKEKILQKEKLLVKRKELETKKKEFQKEIQLLLKEESTVNLLIKQQQEANEKLLNIKKNADKIEKEEELYKIYKGMINDKALPKMILKNTIKQVEREANRMIYSLAGLLVFISSDNSEDDNDNNKGSKWEILIKKNSMVLGSEQVSGYERFVINVGIKMALDKYKFYSGASIFFIDEAFDCISEENLDKIDQLFDYLKSYYRNILIISHNEELKKKVNNRIKIETDFVSSKII